MKNKKFQRKAKEWAAMSDERTEAQTETIDKQATNLNELDEHITEIVARLDGFSKFIDINVGVDSAPVNRSQWKSVLETVDIVNARLANTSKAEETLSKDFRSLHQTFEQIKNRLRDLEEKSKLGGHDAMLTNLGKVANDITLLRKDQSFIADGQTNMNTWIIDLKNELKMLQEIVQNNVIQLAKQIKVVDSKIIQIDSIPRPIDLQCPTAIDLKALSQRVDSMQKLQAQDFAHTVALIRNIEAEEMKRMISEFGVRLAEVYNSHTIRLHQLETRLGKASAICDCTPCEAARNLTDSCENQP